LKNIILGVNCAARQDEEKAEDKTKKWNREKEKERVCKDTSDAFDLERKSYNTASVKCMK